MPNVVIAARGVSKMYPGGIRALDHVDFDVYEGEVHALLGENGAGKSTLAKILYGLVYPDEGYVEYRGVRVRLSSPRDALRLGILYVPQYPVFPRNVTVREVVELFVDARGSGELSDVIAAAESLGWRLELDERAGELQLVDRQRLMLSVAIGLGFDVLLLDEPTSFLSGAEVDRLLDVVEGLKGRLSVVYVTHRIDEVYRIADRVTVLRGGRVAARIDEPRRVPREELLELVVGSSRVAMKVPKGRPLGSTVLHVERLRVRGDDGRLVVDDVSFEVRRGEVIAIVGIEGMGQRELLEAIVGLRRPDSGSVVLKGVKVNNVAVFRSLGGRYVPGDRLDALAVSMSVSENIIVARHVSRIVARLGWILWSLARSLVERLLKSFGVRGSASAPVGSLSGGNQQRVLLARELGVEGASLLVLHNPTAGLDAKGAIELLERISSLAARGVGVVLATPVIDEALAVADRILVMRGGRIIAEFERGVERSVVASAILG